MVRMLPSILFKLKDTFSWSFQTVLQSPCPTFQYDQQWQCSHSPLLLNLEDINLARVFQRLPPVAEPNSHHLSVVFQLSCNFCDLLARWKCVLLKVRVEDLYGLWRETGASFALLGWFAAHKLHQVLLALPVPVFCFRQPLFQHRLQLLSTFRGYVQLLKSTVQKKPLNKARIYFQRRLSS